MTGHRTTQVPTVKPVPPHEAAGLQASQLQARAAVDADILTKHANNTADYALGVAGLQLALTIIATILLIFGYRHSQRALKQSKAAFDEQRTNFLTERRPYVHAHGATITQLEVGKPVEVRFVFRNSGQTPAIETQVQAIVTLGQTTDPIPKVELVPTQSKAILGTQDERSVTTASDAILTAEDLEALKSENLYILISISLAYNDIFGSTHGGRNAFRGVDGCAAAPGAMQVRPWGNEFR